MDKLPVTPEADALIATLADAYTVADLAQMLGRAEQIAQAAGAERLKQRHVFAALEEFGKGENSNE